MNTVLLRALALVACYVLSTMTASAFCIYNTTQVQLDVLQDHGHKSRPMSAKLPPDTHACFPWNRAGTNAKGTKNAALRFKVTYYKPEPQKSTMQTARELRTYWKIARAGVPIQPIIDVPGVLACHEAITASGSLTVAGGPDNWQCLKNSTEDMKSAAAEADLYRPPEHMGDCNTQYHRCAGEARQCRQASCPNLSECQAEYDDCAAYMQSMAPAREPVRTRLLPPPPGEQWGAMASHLGTESFAWDFPTQADAEEGVLAECRRSARTSPEECKLEFSFTRCAASAFAHHSQDTYWVETDSLRAAERDVDQYCRKETGDSCHVAWSFCADGRGGAKPFDLYYGSIALPESGIGKAVMVTNGLYADDAWFKAKQQCRDENGRRCKELVSFATCAAYAESQVGNRYAWGRNESLRRAKQDALAECERSSGVRCEVVLTGCNKGY